MLLKAFLLKVAKARDCVVKGLSDDNIKSVSCIELYGGAVSKKYWYLCDKAINAHKKIGNVLQLTRGLSAILF